MPFSTLFPAVCGGVPPAGTVAAALAVAPDCTGNSSGGGDGSTQCFLCCIAVRPGELALQMPCFTHDCLCYTIACSLLVASGLLRRAM